MASVLETIVAQIHAWQPILKISTESTSPKPSSVSSSKSNDDHEEGKDQGEDTTERDEMQERMNRFYAENKTLLSPEQPSPLDSLDGSHSKEGGEHASKDDNESPMRGAVETEDSEVPLRVDEQITKQVFKISF